MRYSFLLLVSFLAVPFAQAASEQLALAAQFAQAGSPQLALREVEAGQPDSRDNPDWLAWERLRLSLLRTLERPQEIIRRTEPLPAGLPDDFMRDACLAGAHASLRLGQGAQARAYLARLLWRLEPATDYALARRQVLESYLAERRAADAYLVQLRYQQDFPRLDKLIQSRLIELMLDSDMSHEAVTWLPQMDDGPLKLLLKLESGLMTPDVALLEARRSLQKTGSPAYWGVVLRAAQHQQNVLLAQGAREHLLDSAELPVNGPFQVDAQAMWKAYLRLAQDVANQSSLLVGDDASWMQQAMRMAATTPVAARSLLVYVAGAAQDAAMRADAQSQFVVSLRDARLGLVALRLFGQQKVDAVAPTTRYVLGMLASDAAQPGDAARYWRGLDDPPAGFSMQQWQLKRGAVFISARNFADAEAAMNQLLAAAQTEQAHAVLQLLLDLRAAGGGEHAERLLTRWLPLAPPSQHKDILFALGDITENGGQHATAARYFMRLALLAGSREPLMQTARFRAAANLARAGLLDDARSQYRLLLNVTKDKAQQETIRRALAKL